jgi:predicted permease
MLQDFRYALRSLASRPLMATVAVLSLALGIGVNTAIFSVFERLLLRRLPVPAAGQIVNVTSPGPKPGSRSTSNSGRVEAVFSYPLFRDLEHLEVGGLRLAGHRDVSANLAFKGQTSEAKGLLVSGHYFSALGVTPALGRLLGPEDDRVPGAHAVVVLSHDYWTTRFGADPGVIGKTLVVNGEPMTIVGVAHEDFAGTTTLDRTQVFLPLMMAQRSFPDSSWNGMTARNNHWLYIFGRLEAGVTREQAQAMLKVPFTTLIRDVEFPALRSGMGDRDREEFLQRQLLLEDGSRGRNAGRGEAQTILLLMFAITGFVLAIACANVANLLLARVADRTTEISVRLSIGASTARLLRLLLVEACVLGVLGSVGALVVSRITLNGLVAMMPAEDGATLAFQTNTSVLLFTVALGLVTAVLFGLFPALHGVRTGIAAGIHAQSTRTSGSRSAKRFRASLATAQIALATALLATAGLFVVSLVNLARSELGIQREGLVTFRLSPYLNGYSPERALALFERVEDELRGIPGVVAVTSSTMSVLASDSWNNNVTVEGFDAGPDGNTTVSVTRTSLDYFRTLGIPMLAGREFTRADGPGAPKVAIVNEAFARKFNLGSQVIGKRLAMGAGGNRPLDIQIVALVRDAKYSEVREPAPPQLAMPYRQDRVGPLTFYARTSSADTRALVSAIPSLVARLDANLPIANLRTMDDQIWDNTARDRVLSTLSTAFAVLATVLAAIGLYAVLAYGVSQRMREFGIRIALGAKGADVRRLVLGHVTRIALIGSAVGAALAFGMGRLAGAMLTGVDGYDATVIAGAAMLAVIVALLAGALPARRASAVNPIEALRAD